MNSVVCLCGSTRFIDLFDEANRELSKRGLSVITISMNLPTNKQHEQVEQALKELLDLVHLNKILRSDAVFVLDKENYIGRSTAREIIWAQMQSKPIVQFSRTHDWNSATFQIKEGVWYPSIVAHAQQILGQAK